MSDETLFLEKLENYFLTNGFRQVTVEDITSALRCSRRRLYEHAESKEALFYNVVQRFFLRIQSDGRAAAERQNRFDAKIRAYLDAGVRGANQLSDAFQQDIAATDQGRQLYDDHQKKRMDGLREIIQSGIDEGVIRDIHAAVVAEMMLAIVRRFRLPEFQQKAGVSYSDGLSEVNRILRHGIFIDHESEGTALPVSDIRKQTALSQ